MPLSIHFIAGLPRAGSTLLSAILKQNARFRAGIQSPLHTIFLSLLKSMSGTPESQLFITDEQRKRILKSSVEAFYAEHSSIQVIFDSNRNWLGLLRPLAQLFPSARFLCCVRSPAWVLDSIERQVMRNCWQASKLFNFDPNGDVYHRVEHLSKHQLVGPSVRLLRQAWYGEDAAKLIALRYDSLVSRPAETLRRLYEVIGEDPFDHQFDNVVGEAEEFDRSLGMPGFHSVRPSVAMERRETILPPELFAQYDECFWEDRDQNPRGVLII